MRCTLQCEIEATDTDETTHIVLDTNILLGFLDVVQRFADCLEKYGLPALFVIPGIVIDELDK